MLKILPLLFVTTFFVFWSQDPQAKSFVLNANNYETDIPNPVDLSTLSSTNVIHVPTDVADLQDAINLVEEGGVIELAAGTYHPPSTGYQISNMQKGFTIRATEDAEVILEGAGSKNILRFMNTALSFGRPVQFLGITFSNGHSTTPGLAGGVSMYHAEATFIDCIFINNSADQFGSGGGIVVTYKSTAFFINSTWMNNSAMTVGGGLVVHDNAKVYVHGSKFINNRTNLPNHAETSAGGAIHVGNSTIRVSNSHFENNEAGYVGGAIYAFGTWAEPVSTPSTDVIISNSTFLNNRAARDQSVNYSFSTEGGAFHAEAQTTAKIYNSRFITNRAMAGGGISLYQAIVYVTNSTFQGNQATGTGSSGGYGGAITASSNDTISDGNINRRSAYLSIQDSYIEGGYNNSNSIAQGGGGIYAAGDFNRMYGTSGVSQMGNLADNRATVIINNVVLNNLDVHRTSSGGVGGAIFVDMANLKLDYSLIINSDAKGLDNSSGGGLAIIQNSLTNLNETVIAYNSSEKFGGGIFVQGSTINLMNCILFGNTVVSDKYGSAIFSAPDEGRNLPVTGVVHDCIISSNHGLPIFDDDRTNGPINDIRYNSNTIFAGGVNVPVYYDSIPNYSWKSVAELNSLIVTRDNNTSTPKSQIDNTALSTKPSIGGILAAPASLLQTTAAGSSVTQYPVYLAYAWSGGSATLDNQSVSSTLAGVKETLVDGSRTLRVDGYRFSTQVSLAAKPSALFTVSSNATTNTLNWSVDGGTFLEAAIDQGVSITSAPIGSVQVPSTPAREYSFYAITEEGGIYEVVDTAFPELYAPGSVEVLTGLNLPTHFGYINITNTGGGVLEWTAQSNTPNLIQIETPSGQTQITGTVIFSIDVKGRTPGIYNGEVEIDAGAAGNQTVAVTVHIVDILKCTFLPILNH